MKAQMWKLGARNQEGFHQLSVGHHMHTATYNTVQEAPGTTTKNLKVIYFNIIRLLIKIILKTRNLAFSDLWTLCCSNQIGKN